MKLSEATCSLPWHASIILMVFVSYKPVTKPKMCFLSALYQVRLDTLIVRNLLIGKNLYLPSEEFTSCDMVTPFGILFSNDVFPVSCKYPVWGIAFNLNGKVNFYC